MKLFFNLKAWQAFIFVGLLFIVPMFSPFIAVLYDMEIFAIMRWSIPLWLLSYIGYIFSFGYFLGKLSGRNHGLSYYLFTGLAVYSMIFSLLISFFITGGDIFGLPKNEVFQYIFPFQIIAMIGNIYLMRYSAQLLNSVEKEIDAKTVTYLGDFFLFWFLPIGVWSLQPRAAALYKKHTS